MLFRGLLLSLVFVWATAFRATFPRSRVSARSCIDDGAPSDTTIDDPMTFDSVMMSDGPGKAFLLGDCTSLSRLELNEYVLALEKLNPTDEPAYSSKLNGVWEVISTGFGDPAMLSFQIIKSLSKSSLPIDASDVELTISSIQPRVTATSTVSLGPLNVDIAVTTDIESTSSSKLKESYVSAKINNNDIPVSSISSFSRDLIITYLDEDLCISRDQFGSPEILRRKSTDFPLK